MSASSAVPARSSPRDAVLVAASCILLHFMIAQPAGFPLTIAPAAVAGLLFTHYAGSMSVGSLVTLIALLLLPFVNAIGQPATNLVRFARTDGLWTYNVTVLWWAARGTLQAPRSAVVRGAFAANVVIAGFSACQSGLAFLTGLLVLYNPFRGHQYLHEYDAALHDAGVGVLSRAQGFYLEPSFGALVMVTLCVVMLLAGYRARAAMLVVALGLFFNRSATGMIAFAIIVSIHLGLSLGHKVPRVVQLGSAALAAALGALALRQMLAARLAELSVEGASAYYRLVAPLVVLRDVLRFHPLGVEMGQVEAFMVPYGLLQTGSEGNTLDNGLYVLVFYFGWLGVAALLAMIVVTVRHILAGRTRPALLWSYLFMSMAFSGAILVPEYAFLLVLVVYQYRAGTVSYVPRSRRAAHSLVATT